MTEEAMERNEVVNLHRVHQLEAELARVRNDERERIDLEILEHPTCLVVLPLAAPRDRLQGVTVRKTFHLCLAFTVLALLALLGLLLIYIQRETEDSIQATDRVIEDSRRFEEIVTQRRIRREAEQAWQRGQLARIEQERPR